MIFEAKLARGPYYGNCFRRLSRVVDENSAAYKSGQYSAYIFAAIIIIVGCSAYAQRK
jgi:hypothetical protein